MKKSFLQNVVLLLLVFVVAVGGVYLGIATSQRNSMPAVLQEELTSKLTEGSGRLHRPRPGVLPSAGSGERRRNQLH